ncbi:MAG: NUDIX domain-containing protein [bacterium]|nr:NUDIX domain-containing protein [bacterium]
MSWSDITDMLDPRARELLHGRHLMLNDQNQHFRLGVPSGVQIVGFTPDMKVIAITEEKPDGSVYTHLPSGMMNDGEQPEAAAAREFAEETGYRFERLVRLITAKQSSAHLLGDDITFVALGCVKDPNCTAKPDASEKILKAEELAPETLKRKMHADLTSEPHKSVSGRNSYASIQLAMTWAEESGLFDKPVTPASPLLVIIAGQPLAGKTTLGDALSHETGIHFCDIDRLRGKAFGLPTKEINDRRWGGDVTAAAKAMESDMRLAYQLMHDGAVTLSLQAGRSIMVAATYSRKGSQGFLAALAKKCGAKVRVVHCRIASPTREELERRMNREENMVVVSGCNNWTDYQDLAARYQSVTTTGVFHAEQIIEVDTGQPLESYLQRVVEFVRS